MKGFVVASHGKLAYGLKDTLSMFFSNLRQIEFISLGSDESPENFLQIMLEACDDVNTGEGVILFTDMMGGTPNNCAVNLADKFDVITGYNLTLLISFILARENGVIDIERLITESKESIIHINALNKKIVDDDF